LLYLHYYIKKQYGSDTETTNAKKWTEEIVSEHLLFIELDVSAGRVFFVRSILARRGLKSDVWRYWKRIFADNDDIMEQMLVIESHLEANLLESALKNELPARLAKVTLCYHYNWYDKPNVPRCKCLCSKNCPPPGTYERLLKFVIYLIKIMIKIFMYNAIEFNQKGK